MSEVAPGLAALPYVTDARWAAAQGPHRDELLLEQCHLEKKAASAALALLFRLPAGVGRQRELSALAREELLHFERAHKLLSKRGLEFGPQRPSAYAERLKQAVRTTMPERLVDELLVGAIVEARSCERMQLLAAAFAAADHELADFYADLVAAEARHGCLYGELALQLGGPATVGRWQTLTAHEALVLRELPFAPRLHSGVPAASAGV
jgi:tRNA-(ms[2]io[6]A)-hydroxylase